MADPTMVFYVSKEHCPELLGEKIIFIFDMLIHKSSLVDSKRSTPELVYTHRQFDHLRLELMFRGQEG